MNVSSFQRRCLALTATAAALMGGMVIGLDPIASHAAPISPDLLSPAPVGSEAFGEKVLVLSNGNFVVVDSLADGAGPDVGAVYLYNGATDELISTLTGSHSGDQIGSEGVTEVGTSDFVVLSGSWHAGTAAVGAATFVDGSAGLNGVVSPANSIVGSKNLDFVKAGVTALTNGNYVVSAPNWDGSATDVGAVTWANGNGSTSGAISTANSLVGATSADNVGSGNVIALANGNYVVSSPNWDNGSTTNVGAVTWASGTAATGVAVSTANSIVGSGANDQVGFYGATALTNGNYVIDSPYWSSPATAEIGAVTWANGGGITADTVSTNNSLVGVSTGDLANSTVTALTNGDYVVASPFWDGAAAADVGAATWGDGAAATHAGITAADSLVGTTANDNVGFGGVTALTNGNYVVVSPFWSSAAVSEAGAATWAPGDVPTSDIVAAGNSLIGATNTDQVGIGGVTALTNGNYVVSTPTWDKDAANADLGAVTWASGTAATSATVGASNSLVGTTPDDGLLRKADKVGSGGATALSDGNYVVSSPGWNVGGGAGAGAVTWASGTAPTSTAVSPSNSLVGSIATTADGLSLDHVGSGGVTALAGGNYVVSSPDWSGGKALPFGASGAATFVPAGGILGLVTTTNSAMGTQPVEILSASPRLTGHNEVLVATRQNRVLEFQQTDFQPPVILPGDITVRAPDATGPVSVTFPTIATDNVGISAATCVPANGSSFPIGITSVTCTASDTASPPNTSSKTFSVTVLAQDTTAPVLTVPAAITVGTAPGATTQTVSFSVTATDNVAVQSVGCDRASGSVFALGDTTVHCTATDTSGLTASKSFTVTVADGEHPVLIGMPGNFAFDVDAGGTTRAVSFDAPTATDNVGVQSVVCDHLSGSFFPVGVTTVTCTATDVSGLTTSGSFTVTVTAAVTIPTPVPPAANDYQSLTGARLADTRPGATTTDMLFAGDGVRPAGSTLELTVANRGGVAADAAAAALNVTAVGATAAGFVTVYPCGSPQPTASNLNYTAGTIVPNAVIAKIGSNGKVCLFVSAATHLVVDVNGSFPASASYQAMNPARVLETRSGLPTVDGQQQGDGLRAGGSVTRVQITGRASVPPDAAAVALNVTVTEAQGPGFVTVFPCGTAIPTASNINYTAGSTLANLVVSKIGDGGAVCVFTNQGTHLVVDVNGYFPSSTSYRPLVPARLLDSRSGESTIDGLFLGAGRREAGEVTEVKVTDRGGVSPVAGTVVLNVTVTGPTAAGFITVYPCGIATPLASNLNYERGATVANAVFAKVGTDGKVCLFNSGPTQLVVDVNGYFP